MKFKKLFSVMLAAVMIFSMVSIGAFADAVENAASVNGTEHATLQAAIDAAAEGDTVLLLKDTTVSQKVTITKGIVLDGNNKTLTYTGYDRAIDIPKETGAKEVTVKNLTVDCTSGYSERGINFNTNGKFNLSGVTVKGLSITYALNLPGKASNCEVVIENCDLSGCIALNVWGSNSTINATNTNFKCVDNTDAEKYATVKLNNDGETSAEGTVVNITGGSIIATGDSDAVYNSTSTGAINVSETTVVEIESGEETGEGKVAVTYAGYTEFYSFKTLQAAIDVASDDENATVKLIGNLELTEPVTVTGSVKLDLNGYTIRGEKAATSSYAMIYNNGTLVIDDTSETKAGKISFKDTGAGDASASWGSYTIRNNGTLTINNGTIENISEQNNGQTSMKHVYFAIMTYSGNLTVNNGTISTPSYRSVDFWGGNLTVNGGEFIGQIWVRPLASGAVIDINGGEFAPCWRDGSSVYITTYDGQNTYKGAEAEISGGMFNGKVGCSTPEDLAGCITGGTFTETAKAGTNSALIASSLEFKQDENGNFVISKKPTWTTGVDAGFYSVEGRTEKFGLMRFLFHIDYEGEIAGSGIRYFNSNDITEGITAGKGGVEGSKKAFFGDIVNVPEGTGGTYYAIAYINIGTVDAPEYIWSIAVECSPNFNKEFKNYTPLVGGNE